MPIACDLSAIAAASRPRYFSLRARVMAAADEVIETSDGYTLRLGADPDILMALAEWIGFERLCCPFLRFRVDLSEGAPVRLELGGGDGVKQLLRGELAEAGSVNLTPASSLVRARRT